ncbi:MAG: GGDEF domain-containing protein [Dehalococcoidia bacterium]
MPREPDSTLPDVRPDEVRRGRAGLWFPPLLEHRYQAFYEQRFRGWIRLASLVCLAALGLRLTIIPFVSMQGVAPTLAIGSVHLSTLALLYVANLLAIAVGLAGAVRLFRGGSVVRAQQSAMAAGLILMAAFFLTGNLRETPSYLSPVSIPLVLYALVLGFRLQFLQSCLVAAATVSGQLVAATVNGFEPAFNLTSIVIVVPYALLAVMVSSMLDRETRNDFLARRLLQRDREALAALSTRLAADASTDELTQVANRRRFDEALAEEWRRARRSGEAISLVMFDIDHFKPLNDRFGHLRGDGVLVLVAERLRSFAKRPGDLIARYGGEEFVLILSGATRPAAAEIAERARQAIHALAIPNGNDPPGVVTVSAGVATALPDQSDDPADLVRAADMALYRAKERGRNRVDLDGQDCWLHKPSEAVGSS